MKGSGCLYGLPGQGVHFLSQSQLLPTCLTVCNGCGDYKQKSKLIIGKWFEEIEVWYKVKVGFFDLRVGKVLPMVLPNQKWHTLRSNFGFIFEKKICSLLSKSWGLFDGNFLKLHRAQVTNFPERNFWVLSIYQHYDYHIFWSLSTKWFVATRHHHMGKVFPKMDNFSWKSN